MAKPRTAESPPPEVEGTVASISGRGDSRYVVVNVNDRAVKRKLDNSTVTVTLTNWLGDLEPQHGQQVLMSGLQKFAKGWRATKARPITLG